MLTSDNLGWLKKHNFKNKQKQWLNNNYIFGAYNLTNLRNGKFHMCFECLRKHLLLKYK